MREVLTRLRMEWQEIKIEIRMSSTNHRQQTGRQMVLVNHLGFNSEQSGFPRVINACSNIGDKFYFNSPLIKQFRC